MVVILILAAVIGWSSFYFLSQRKGHAASSEDEQGGEISSKVRLQAYISGGYYKLYRKKIAGGMSEKDSLNYISKGLGDKLIRRADELYLQAENAEFNFTGNFEEPFVYLQEKKGQRVDTGKLFSDTARSFDDRRKVEMFIIESEPEINIDILMERTAKRSVFSTNFSTSPISRKSNIALAARYLNGHIIEPKGTMSFNEAVGPRTPLRGFQKANIIYQGEMVQGYGGGVCQVSSTVYNACILGGLEIVKASRHSRIIPYLPPSRDAMVSASSDLLIYNPTEYPVYIITKATQNELFIAVYGQKSEYELKISNRIVKTIKPKPDKISVQGDNVPEHIKDALMSDNPERMKHIAYHEIRKVARDGLISEAYLEKYKDGILVESKLISRDTYPPQQGEIIRIVQ